MIMNKLMELIIVLFITIIIFYIPYIIIKFIITYKECKEESNHFYKTLPEQIEKLALQKSIKCNYIVGYSIQNDIYTVFYMNYYGRTEYKDIHKTFVNSYLDLAEKEIKNRIYYRYLEKPILVRTIERIFN